MVSADTSAGRRTLLSRLYSTYGNDGTFSPYRVPGTRLVTGAGPTIPKIMFVGASPTSIDQRSGHPFCGKPGEVLDQLLFSVGLTRDTVYLTTVVKYHGREGAQPVFIENRTSLPYLRTEHRILGYPPMVLFGRKTREVVQQLSVRTIILPSPALRQDHWSWLQFPTTPGFPVLPLEDPASSVYSRARMPGMIEKFQQVVNPPKYNIF